MAGSGQEVMTTASVELWGRRIGAVTWVADRGVGIFQYTPEFVMTGIEVAPLQMPLREAPYGFPALSRATFRGLPGMLADSLPDKFGNALISLWLERQDREDASFNSVERLCFIGSRGMGALEYKPATEGIPTKAGKVEVERLAALSNQILNDRDNLAGQLTGDDDLRDIDDILRVGTCAGGARAKAVLAWNQQIGEFRSGQIASGKGFTHWLMKFDGVVENKDKELADPDGFGRIEYAYHLMAKEAGLTMMPCRLHEEGGRAHFMTKRFDRTDEGDRLHYQSLCALQHLDFNMAGAHSYEQAVLAIKSLTLPVEDIGQLICRAVFNLIARNQDDHVKNIGFVMDREGEWRLAPAFDVAYSYNPDGFWTSQHQMSLNGKRDGFELGDLVAFGEFAGLKKRKMKTIISEMIDIVKQWTEFAERAQVHDEHVTRIQRRFRIDAFSEI